MLDELAVTNLGVIAAASVEPGEGLVVVTGETGAGKTLLLGALELLTGASASSALVGPAAPEAMVEGRFLAGEEEFVAGRRMVRGGRSRAYLDGGMVPRKALAARLESLVEMVGQHEHLALTRPAEVRSLVDGALDDDGRKAQSEYESAWSRLRSIREDQARLGGDRRALERELELVRYQADDVAAAGFLVGDDEELVRRSARLAHATALSQALASARAALGGSEGLGVAVTELRTAAGLDQSLQPLVESAEEVAALAAELAAEAGRVGDTIEDDPAAYQEVETRLTLLGDLRRKYGETLAEILEFGEGATARVAELEGLLERATSIELEVAQAAAAVEEAGEQLRRARRRAATQLASDAIAHLRELGLDDPVVAVAVDPVPPAARGADAVELAFASDASLPPGPVTQVASGGELSRLVLALRLAGGLGAAPIIAFDEIDAGIGGATALAMGRKLARLARRRQVLCVTHLPQVAAYADTHIVVRKTGNEATVGPVEGEARLEELARMLSGLPESEGGRGHASELLARAAGDGR